MRKQAEELAKTAASQVSDINSKLATPGGMKTANVGSDVLATPAAPTPVAPMKSPENISKEELLDVLQKMNKKVKALTSLRTQLADRVKAAEADKERLMNLVKDEILSGEVTLEDGQDPVEQLQKAWHQVDERNSLALQGLQAEYKTVAMQCKVEVDEVKKAVEAEAQAKVDRIRADVAAETLANGNEAWEVMREQLAKRHQEEAQLLRKELHEQYDFQLAQKEQEFNQKLAETIELSRQEMEEKLGARLSDRNDVGSSDAIEALKVQHAEEMSKLKQAAAAQLQGLKKKIAAARAAEIEKIKKETAEAKDAEAAAKIEELITKHQEQMEELRNEVSTDPPTQEELDRLKAELQTSHMEELESVKQRIAQSLGETQLETLEEMRQQRENELRAVRAEMQALSDAQVQQAKIDTENQFKAKFTELQQTQGKELERIASQLTKMHEENIMLKDRLKEMQIVVDSDQVKIEQMNLQCNERIEEVNRSAAAQFESQANELRMVLRNDYERRLKQCQADADGQVQKALDDTAAQHKEQMATLRKSLTEERQLLQSSLEDELKQKLEMFQSEAAVNICTVTTEARSQAREEAEHAKAMLEKEHEAKLIELKSMHDGMLSKAIHEAQSSAVRESETLHAKLIQQLNEMKSKEKALSDEVRAAREGEAAMRQIADQCKQDLDALQKSTGVEMEQLRMSMNDELRDKVQKLQGDAVLNLESALSDAIHVASEEKATLELENEAKLNELKRESEVAIVKAIQKAESSAAEQIDSIRSEFANQLDKFCSMEHALKEELRESKYREESRLSELQDLRAKIAATEEDRQALAEAAQNGESSAKMLEERLAAQRSSFDVSMASVKEQYAQDRQQLLQHEQELASANADLEKELEASRLLTSQLQTHVHSIRQELDEVKKDFKDQGNDYEGRLTALRETHASEMNRLIRNIQENQDAHTTELENARSELEQRVSQLQNALDSSAMAMQTMKEKHESEIASLEQNQNQELNQAREQLGAYEQKLQQLYAQVNNNDETHANLLTELEKTRSCLIEVENETRSLRDTSEVSIAQLQNDLDTANAATQSLKEHYEFEIGAMREKYEQELSQARALAEEHKESLQQVNAKVVTAEEAYAAVFNELERTRSRLVELEAEASEARTALTTQLERLEREKDAAVEQRANASKRAEEVLAQHQATTSALEEQLENSRQEFAEREHALQRKIGQLMEESQTIGQTVSDEVENLKKEIEKLNVEHESALHQQQLSIARALSDHECQLAEALRAAEIEKQSALNALQEDYEAKLTDARDKQTKAVDIVKKLKAATAAKLQGIEKERAAEKAASEEEKSTLGSKLNAIHDADIAALHEVHANLTQEWESKIVAKGKEYEDALLIAKSEWDKQLDQLKQEQQQTILSLQAALENATQQLQEASSTSSEEAQRDLETKIAGIHNQYRCQLNSMADAHASELESIQATVQEQIQKAKTEQEETTTKLVNEKERELEASKQEQEERVLELASKHGEEMKTMQEKLAAHVDELKRRFIEKLQVTESKHTDEMKSLTEQLNAREDQLTNIVRQLNEKSLEVSTLEKKYEALQTKFSSDVVVKQALQKKMEELQKQLTEMTSNTSKATQALLQQKEELEGQRFALEERMKLIAQDRDTNKNKVEELMGKLEALGSNLNVTLEEKNKLESELQSVSKKAAKLDTTESELNVLRDQINKLKLDQTKSNSLLEKLQVEKEANTRNHGQRTALVGMLEEQLADLNEKNSDMNAKLEAAKYDLSARDEDIQSLQEQLANAQRAVAEAHNARKQANESLSSAQKGADTKKSKMIETLQREVQSLQQQMAKKSAAAQKLIQQREAECIELRKTAKALQLEVDKGSLSDRRIFELAAQQSNRESVAVSEIEVRDKMVDKLTEKLEVQDVDLAKAEYNVKHYENQVEELCRIRRREDVNLDYLKGIVVQYLSKPPGSSEREALLPVLATLLQFDSNDYKTIEDGKNKLSWWGGVSPILITPPTPKPARQEQAAPLLSAEISVSRTTSAEAALNNVRSRTTSLEF